MLEEKNRLLGQVFDLEQQKQHLQENKEHLDAHAVQCHWRPPVDVCCPPADLQEDNKHLQEVANDTANCVKVSIFSSAQASCLQVHVHVCVSVCLCVCMCHGR